MSTEETGKNTDGGVDEEEWLYGGEIRSLTINRVLVTMYPLDCYYISFCHLHLEKSYPSQFQ